MFQTINKLSAKNIRYTVSEGYLTHKSSDPTSVIYWWIVLSIVIHYVAIFFTGYLGSPKPLRHHQTAALKIKITQNLQVAHESHHTGGRSDARPRSKEHAKTRGEASSPKSLVYSDLLPNNNTSIVGSTSDDSTPFAKADLAPEKLMEKTTIGRYYGLRGQRVTPEVERKLDEFATRIQVPLIWRNLAKESKAEATLRLGDGDALIVESLYGEPMLRAAMFFGLSDYKNRKKLVSDMRKQNIARYRVVLRYLPVNEPISGLGLSIAAFDDGVVITKLLPQVMKQFPGISLEDEESRRAKRREQAQISKLMESPAFQHPVRDYRLDD